MSVSSSATLMLMMPLALTASAAAQTEAPREANFDFAEVGFASDCMPSAEFDRLTGVISGLPSADAAGATGAAVPDETLYNAVSGNVTQELRLDRPEPWHGLSLVGIRLFNGIERGPVNRSMLFSDDLTTVRAVWAQRGIALTATGELRPIHGDAVVDGAIGIDRDGALTVVTCYSD